MKSLILVLALGAAPAFGDQCMGLSPAEALGAAELLKPGSTVMDYCEACAGDEEQKIYEVKSVQAVPDSQSSDSYYVLVNGVKVDLAYLFLQTKGQYADDDLAVFTNVSKMVGCYSDRVSSFLKIQTSTEGEGGE